jgi:hypothetical protein
MDCARAKDRDGRFGMIKQSAFDNNLSRRVGGGTGITVGCVSGIGTGRSGKPLCRASSKVLPRASQYTLADEMTTRVPTPSCTSINWRAC